MYHWFTIYKVYHKKAWRYMAILVNNLTKKKRSMSWAKYIYTDYYNKEIPKWVQIDHIDWNKLNDDVSNLQELSQKKNIQKAFIELWLEEKQFELECPICWTIFYRTKQRIRDLNTQCCSRSCGWKQSALTLWKKIKKSI